MATVKLNLKESAIIVSALQKHEPEDFATADPSEIIHAVERWLASTIEARDWESLNGFDTQAIAWHLRTDRILNGSTAMRS